MLNKSKSVILSETLTLLESVCADPLSVIEY